MARSGCTSTAARGLSAANFQVGAAAADRDVSLCLPGKFPTTTSLRHSLLTSCGTSAASTPAVWGEIESRTVCRLVRERAELFVSCVRLGTTCRASFILKMR